MICVGVVKHVDKDATECCDARDAAAADVELCIIVLPHVINASRFTDQHSLMTKAHGTNDDSGDCLVGLLAFDSVQSI